MCSQNGSGVMYTKGTSSCPVTLCHPAPVTVRCLVPQTVWCREPVCQESVIPEKQTPGMGSHGEVELHLGTGSSLDRRGAGDPGWRVGRFSPSLKAREAGALTSEGKRGSLQLTEREKSMPTHGEGICALGPLTHLLVCSGDCPRRSCRGGALVRAMVLPLIP